jgi:hypothetical protein
VREEIKLKGSVLWGVLQALEIVAGWDRREDIVAALSGDFGEGIRTRSIIATGWYPIAWHRELLGAIVMQGGQTALRDTVRVATRENVSTIHRLLVRVFSRDTLLKQGTRVFSSFFEARAVATRETPIRSRVEWLDCRGFDQNIWIAQAETVQALVEMAGSKVQRSQVISGGTNLDDSMVLELGF